MFQLYAVTVLWPAWSYNLPVNLCDVSDEVSNGERVEGTQGQGLVCSMESDRYPHHVVNRWIWEVGDRGS